MLACCHRTTHAGQGFSPANPGEQARRPAPRAHYTGESQVCDSLQGTSGYLAAGVSVSAFSRPLSNRAVQQGVEGGPRPRHEEDLVGEQPFGHANQDVIEPDPARATSCCPRVPSGTAPEYPRAAPRGSRTARTAARRDMKVYSRVWVGRDAGLTVVELPEQRLQPHDRENDVAGCDDEPRPPLGRLVAPRRRSRNPSGRFRCSMMSSSST